MAMTTGRVIHLLDGPASLAEGGISSYVLVLPPQVEGPPRSLMGCESAVPGYPDKITFQMELLSLAAPLLCSAFPPWPVTGPCKKTL